MGNAVLPQIYGAEPCKALARPPPRPARAGEWGWPPPPPPPKNPKSVGAAVGQPLPGSSRPQVLLYGQLYRISLELELPESPANRALGMFMVTVTCYGAGGRPLASAARAVSAAP